MEEFSDRALKQDWLLYIFISLIVFAPTIIIVSALLITWGILRGFGVNHSFIYTIIIWGSFLIIKQTYPNIMRLFAASERNKKNIQ